MTKRTAAMIAAIGLSMGLAACETATPYQPLQRGSHTGGGFSERRLDADHFGVTFRGNADTPRATVESYMLYRAAEITVAQGYDWFETVDHHTDRRTETRVEPDPFYGPGYRWGYFRPDWEFYGPGYGWRGRGPYWGGADVETFQKFRASAEIALHHGPKPGDNPRALDAREVLANLGPKIKRPKV
jgi:hypothetical protein